MNDKPETIFDHNLSKDEAFAVLGWADITENRIAWYFETTHGDWFLYHLAALYEYRGDEKRCRSISIAAKTRKPLRGLDFIITDSSRFHYKNLLLSTETTFRNPLRSFCPFLPPVP